MNNQARNPTNTAVNMPRKTVDFLDGAMGRARAAYDLPMSAWTPIHPLFIRSMEEKKSKGMGGGIPGGGCSGWSTGL